MLVMLVTGTVVSSMITSPVEFSPELISFFVDSMLVPAAVALRLRFVSHWDAPQNSLLHMHCPSGKYAPIHSSDSQT